MYLSYIFYFKESTIITKNKQTKKKNRKQNKYKKKEYRNVEGKSLPISQSPPFFSCFLYN